MLDIIVVGAGCAGAASALLLARAGHRVRLIERRAFPAPKLSTLYLQPQGVDLLRRWDVLPGVVASGCPKLDTITYGAQGVVLHGPSPRFGGSDGSYAPKREVLDGLLVDAAIEAGAQLDDRTKFLGAVTEDRRVRAVRLCGPDGAMRIERTDLLVGADGMRSAVAASVGARDQMRAPIKTCVYYGSWLDLGTDAGSGFEFHERTGSWIAVIPTNDGETVVAAYFPQSEFPRVRLDPHPAVRDAVAATAPDVHRRLVKARPVGKLKGTGAQENFFRVPVGPGWALIGDAGHHKDSITARGITDGLIQAQLLVDVLAPGADVDEALAQFHRDRDAALIAGYEATLSVADLAIPPARLEILRAISVSPQLCTRYFAVVAGVEPLQDTLTEELLALL